MATLKGMFDPKPPQQRNFLLENIKRVKVKSSLNNKKDDKAKELVSKDTRDVMRTSSSSSTISPNPPKSLPLKSDSVHSIGGVIKEPLFLSNNKKHTCHCASGRESATSSKQQRISSRPIHYIHQENVPFEWTEMCPSLVSHSICHQSVQTEECDGDSPSMRSTQQKKYFKERAFDSSDKSNENDLLCDTSQKQSISHIVRHKSSDQCVPSQKPCPNADSKNIDEISELESLKPSAGVSSRKPPILLPSTYQKGVVPKYLMRRKNEQLLEASQLKAVDPKCPIGHVVMPETERKETLNVILKNYNELVAELNRLPVRTDTLKTKQRKIELEKQLDKLEEGIRVFSRSKVYIKLQD